ncbi:MAG: hypothetical protein ABI277_04820 [Burkholderiaceae bacterium]
MHDDPAAEAGLSAAFIRYPDLEVEVHDSIGGSALPPGPCGSTADVVVADYAHGIALAMQSARASNASNSPEVMILAGLDREWEIRYALARGVRGSCWSAARSTKSPMASVPYTAARGISARGSQRDWPRACRSSR